MGECLSVRLNYTWSSWREANIKHFDLLLWLNSYTVAKRHRTKAPTMVNSAVRQDRDELFIGTLASEIIGVVRIYFYRGEVIIDKTASFFRKRKLLKNYLIESAKKNGINSIIYFESVSGYQQYQSIQNEHSDAYNSKITSIIEIIDYKDRIERFFTLNAELLSGHMIIYEEKKRLVVPSNTLSNRPDKEKLRVFLDGTRLGG